jgi:hypothetical protein
VKNANLDGNPYLTRAEAKKPPTDVQDNLKSSVIWR